MQEFKQKLEKTIQTLHSELKGLRVGRANPTMLEEVQVEAYDSKMPLEQVAAITVPQNNQLLVQPWDKALVGAVQKAIAGAGLGLNPVVEGDTAVRITLPPLTEETRKDLIKEVSKHGEGARIAVRNIREDILKDLDKQKEEKNLSEDDYFKQKEEVQDTVNQYNTKIDEVISNKEKEITEH